MLLFCFSILDEVAERVEVANRIADTIPCDRVNSTPVLPGTRKTIKDQFALLSPIVGAHQNGLVINLHHFSGIDVFKMGHVLK